MEKKKKAEWLPHYEDEVLARLKVLGQEEVKGIIVDIIKSIGTNIPMRIEFSVGRGLDSIRLRVGLPTTDAELVKKYSMAKQFQKSIGSSEVAEDVHTEEQKVRLAVLQALPFQEEFMRVKIEGQRIEFAPELEFRSAESIENFVKHMNVHFPKVWSGHLRHYRVT